MKELISQIEALLFAAGEPVEVQKMASFLGVSKKEVEEQIEELSSLFESEKRGLQIIKKANTIQLVSASQHGELVAKFLNKKLHEPLSLAALEVLSVVAYRGPMTRAQIEHIRGVNCSFTLRNLSMRGIVERKENPADTRSYLYEVSGEFLKSAGLSDINELPEYEQLHAHKIPEASDEEVAKEDSEKELKEIQK